MLIRRSFDITKPVYVYRNLNRKGRWYSIKQNGLVVAYSEELCLKKVKFIVNKKGKERCHKTKQRNVHAYLKGLIDYEWKLGIKINYNPYSEKGFVTPLGYEIDYAENVRIDKNGVFASYYENARIYNQN